MAVTLQNCLDKIGYTGSQTATLPVLQDLYTALASTCPVSTLHIDGTVLNVEEDAKNRVIIQGVGGTCSALAVVFKFILDEIGFTSRFVSCSNKPSNLGIVTTIGSDEYFSIFGYYVQGLYEPIKVEHGYTIRDLSVSFDNPLYKVDNSTTGYMFCFDPAAKTLADVQSDIESETTSGILLDIEFLSIYLGLGVSRTLFNGQFKATDEQDYTIYDSGQHNLLTLFQYSGTL